jgi:NhaA family Na+:H+ antiporter
VQPHEHHHVPTTHPRRRLGVRLQDERFAGLLLLAAAVAALVWANSAWRETYHAIAGTVLGPAALHLDLTVSAWAADGLLAVFFFVVGLELKREIVDGQLRRPATAVVPIVAAVGGMVVPAAIYLLVNARPGGVSDGWAIPVATDIAFAVAVLTVFGRRLPSALRAFLLTLAVVDDLLGIIVIAVWYTDGLALAWLGAAAAAAVAFGVLSRVPGRWARAVMVPVAVLAWYAMHASGIHATIAGVLLAFTVPAIARPGETESVAARYEHVWRPVSAGVAVPVFALFAAGVRLDGQAIAQAVGEPAAQGVFLGLVVGKPVGILLTTFLLVRLTRASIDDVRWGDLVAVACVGGIGFTVSLLIGELSFAEGDAVGEHAKAAILAGSLVAAAIGATLLAWRSRRHAVSTTD